MAKVRWTKQQYEKKIGKAKVASASNTEFITITVLHPLPSLNQIYGGKHWKERVKVKEAISIIFQPLLLPYLNARFAEFELVMTYNSALDPDNTVYGAKIFIDLCRKLDIIPNDNKKFYKGLFIVPDLNLKSPTYILTLRKHEKAL